MKKYLKKKFIIFYVVFIFAILARFSVAVLYGDSAMQNEWLILFYNFKNLGTIGINVFDGSQVIMRIAREGDLLLPSIYMPPFYLFFIVIIDFFVTSSKIMLPAAIISVQILISILSSFFFYKILIRFFSRQVSIFGLIIFLFYPLNIYITSQISSGTLQVSFTVIFYYLFLELINKKSFLIVFFFSIISSILILLRGEFLVTLFLAFFFMLLELKKAKYLFLSCIIIVLCLSPYLKRNFNYFNEIIITKSLGFNLWKGNNLNSGITGREYIYDKNFKDKIDNLEPNNFYEIEKDSLYLEEAIKNILGYPKFYFLNFLKKILSYMFFNFDKITEKKILFYYFLPKLLISITTLFGIFLLFKKDERFFKYILVFFLTKIVLISIFFILPRYQLGIIHHQIILSCVFFEFLKNKIKKFFL